MRAKVTIAAGEAAPTILKEETTDPFRLVRQTNGAPAVISLSVGKTIGYGDWKVSASVTLTCDQDEKTIDEAGGLAFLKATEFLNDALEVLQAQPVKT